MNVLPLVSVVIPNFNGADFIEEAIHSVLAQTYKNIEIIVIDDGSMDNSVEAISCFGNSIKLIRSSNQGASSARNLGLEAANGFYVALLDSDDIWMPDKIERQVAEMTLGNFELVYCSLLEFDETGITGSVLKAKYAGDCYKFFKKFPDSSIVIGGCSTALIKASILKNSGLFDQSFIGVGEDLDFFRRISKIGSMGYLTDTLVLYRKHRESITAGSLMEYFKGNQKAVSKMIFEDRSLSRFEIKLIWMRLNSRYVKAFVKSRDYSTVFLLIFSLFKSYK